MKRFLVLMCSFVFLIISLNGCVFLPAKSAENADFTSIYFEECNYNNYGNIFISEDVTLYSSFYSYLYINYNGNNYKLFSDKDFKDDAYFTAPYYGVGKDIYFQVYPDDYDDEKSTIYRYSLEKKELEPIIELESVYSWLPMQNYIVYLKEFDADSGLSSIYYYDISKKTENLIASEIEEFIITDGLIKYVVYSDGYQIFSYDPVLDATISHGVVTNYIQKENVSFYFTSNKVIMFPETQNEYQDLTEYSVFDINEQSTSTYQLPQNYYSFVPSDEYAYVLTYDDTEEADVIFSGSYYNQSIYKIKLSTGEATELPIDAKNIDDIYVDNDDNVYTVKYKYSSTLFDKTVISKYNPVTQTTEKLF